MTSAKDAQLIALAGADAVGLNCFTGSSRYVDPTTAEKIVTALPGHVARVGLFVNPTPGEVLELADRLKLDWIQLHGDEPVEMLETLAGHSVLRAIRYGADGINPAVQFLAACKRKQVRPAAILMDAAVPGEYGGTGQTIDWTALARDREQLGDIPLVLAGGLTPFNVSEAIATVRPNAVDVASGVEAKTGSKDLLLVRAFITSAKKAFAGL